jgi:hypothetical protein
MREERESEHQLDRSNAAPAGIPAPSSHTHPAARAAASPLSRAISSPEAIRQLHQMAGNRAVGRLLNRSGRQLMRTDRPMPEPTNVYAAHYGTPAAPVCEDAVLRPGEIGQAGWERGINYVTLNDLIAHMGTGVQRLAISCHGQAMQEPGGLYLEDDLKAHLVTADRLRTAQYGWDATWDTEHPGSYYDRPYFVRMLVKLGQLRERLLTPGATVLLVSCGVAREANPSGVDLLSLLGDLLNCRVVGFTMTVDTSTNSSRGMCYTPGAQITTHSISPGTVAFGEGTGVAGWADETLSQAFIAEPDGSVSGNGMTARGSQSAPERGPDGWPLPLAPLRPLPVRNPRPSSGQATYLRDPVTGRRVRVSPR